ncbi:MAG: FmdB family zinc ribbon protein [Thermoleophilia bacterium]
MVTYQYLCDEDGMAEVRLPMGDASPTIDCPQCGGAARRVYSSPMLATGGDPMSRRLIEATTATSDRPDVVTSIPSHGGPSTQQRVTANPLHKKLPRP